ncbi:MAG: MmcQ/YjbR family DNA-binding protein, partial [Nocardioides sp.]
GTAGRPAWYVDNRLVARLEDATTLTVRSSFAARERLVRAHSETFGVPPALESHRKVQVALDHGNDEAIREVITAAYDLQRKR